LKLEAGSFRQSIELARNLERVLKVRIVKELRNEDTHITPPPTPTRRLTLGDILSSRRKEKRKSSPVLREDISFVLVGPLYAAGSGRNRRARVYV
jgi:hypothetical protein